MTLTKVCVCCSEEKPAREFGVNRSLPDGLQIYCSSCWQDNNAIVKLGERMVGGRKVYRALDKFSRLKVRKGAARLFAAGVNYITAVSNELTSRDGFVYVIINTAWPQYVKVGRAYDPESRLRGYQTASPHRDYKLAFACYFEDCFQAEKEIHARIDTFPDTDGGGEWFKCTPQWAANQIKALREIL